MRRTATVSRLMAMALVLTATICVPRAQAQSKAETFTATASVKTAAGVSVTAPVVISITRWTTAAERTTALAALKSGGNAALKKTFDTMPEAGTIQIGEKKTALKFAGALSTGSGRVVTVVASQPILYIGAGLPESKVKAGFELGYAMFVIDAAGKGSAGDLAPAATLKLDANDALVVQDFGAEAVRLIGISKK